MFERLDEIDWNALGVPQIPALLQAMQSEDRHTSIEAYSQLAEIITPERVLEGYENWSGGLVGMMQSEVPCAVTPFLIHRLENESDRARKIGTLELLHDLCGYELLKTWIIETSPNRKPYETWAQRISDAVRQGTSVYNRLLDDDTAMVRIVAQQVLDILDKTRK